MFEKEEPKSTAQSRRITAREIPSVDASLANSVAPTSDIEGDGGALRAIEWGELRARLDAARDLRLLLRRDIDRDIEADSARFADTAARYFRNREEGEPDVNPVALEHCKALSGMLEKSKRYRSDQTQIPERAAPGDAREER